MSDYLQATFKEDEPLVVHVKMVESGNMDRVWQKSITIDSFRDIINNSTTGVDYLRIGKLPKGFYDGKIGRNAFAAIIYIPGDIFTMHYFKDTFYIPYPNTVFYFLVKENAITGTYVFAVKDDKLSDDTLLCHYPFPNVYENGTICWGSNNLGNEFYDLKSLESAVLQFYGAATNNDLWQDKYVSKRYEAPRIMYEQLSKENTFPYDILLPMNMRVGELLV